jgi:CheY-like chemotaxis protein
MGAGKTSSADAAPALRGLRILLVEDEAMVAMMLEDMLEGLGCAVVGVAANVSEGLALAGDDALRVDGAVLDVNLGGEKVYAVARRLGERGVPFIFATGFDVTDAGEEFARIPLLRKPYRVADLAKTLATAVTTRG